MRDGELHRTVPENLEDASATDLPLKLLPETGSCKNSQRSPPTARTVPHGPLPPLGPASSRAGFLYSAPG